MDKFLQWQNEMNDATHDDSSSTSASSSNGHRESHTSKLVHELDRNHNSHRN